jgi:hypothetical protein
MAMPAHSLLGAGLGSEDSPIFFFSHPRMYTAPFPKKKIITPAPRLRFTGHLDILGTRIDVRDWIGLRGHNWGSEHAFSYAYGNCNLFREDPEALIDLFTAKVRVGPLITPWVSLGILRQTVSSTAFAHCDGPSPRAVVAFPHWAVTLRRPNLSLETHWQADPAQTVCLRYLHPNGRLAYCYNTKFATLTARLDGLELTSDQAELEFLTNEPLPDIVPHGHAELPE